MNNASRLAVLVIGMAIGHAANAASPANAANPAGAGEIVCPATILGSTAVTTAEGWEPVGGAAEYRLEHTQLYFGHPRDDTPLRPEAESGDEQRWRLPDPLSGEAWVGCAYRDTSIVLARKLDARLTQCSARRETVERAGKGGDVHATEAQPALTCS